MDKTQTAKQRAQAKYDAKRKKININFNMEHEQDLFQAACNMDNFGGWVKEQIKSYIKQSDK
jgi:hypothetical protein